MQAAIFHLNYHDSLIDSQYYQLESEFFYSPILTTDETRPEAHSRACRDPSKE
jgi:hypothetical protein